MIPVTSNTSSEIHTDDILKNTKDEHDKNGIKKKHFHIVKEQQGNYDCIYLVDNNGKKTLIEKIPVLRSTKNTNKDSNNFNNLFNFDNPKFVSEAVINNTRASLNFRQQMYHRNDLTEMIDLLKAKAL